MFELKPISSAGVPRAIAKAERYRLLNEPEEAESICLDILQVDADNQEVLVMLLLAITDQFGKNPDVGAGHAKRVLAKLPEKPPANSYGRRLFQEMSYHDTPEPPVAEMRYVDHTAKAGEKHTYAVVTINSAGLRSKPRRNE